MKFLVDVGVGRQVERWLLAYGYDVKAVRDIDPGMPDREILKIAAQESRIVVTMDKDFGEMVYYAGRSHSGVLLLRLDEATGQEKVAVVAEIVAHYADKLTGNFAVYQRGRLRIRER
jgi:predicted nuclease of predicted toxin-antitoxin system